MLKSRSFIIKSVEAKLVGDAYSLQMIKMFYVYFTPEWNDF